jgi:hypothetical protein
MDEAHYRARPGPRSDDIAIVGYALKLPQNVEDDAAFWEVLQQRRNLRTDCPESRINAEAFVNDKTRKVRQPIALMLSVLELICDRSSTAVVGILSMRTPVPLMPPFSPSRPRRPRPWTRCSDGHWKRHIMRLKTVSDIHEP